MRLHQWTACLHGRGDVSEVDDIIRVRVYLPVDIAQRISDEVIAAQIRIDMAAMGFFDARATANRLVGKFVRR